MGTVTTIIDIEAPLVCFEPCANYQDDPAAEGACAACGWPADDHPDHCAEAA